jgi:mRNA-degrading endonuclease RelE of RelBE toxin-antitoxin system
MAWNLHITGPAQKEFQKLSARDQARVKDALLAMQQDPFSGDIKRLKGQPAARRRRVGNYRIVYDLALKSSGLLWPEFCGEPQLRTKISTFSGGIMVV